MIVGDFNYPSINWNDWCTSENENHPSFTFIECLRDNFLSQFILEPTRYREGQRSNILDLFLTDKSEIVQRVSYETNLGASDHISFMVELLCSPTKIESNTIKRNFYRGNYIAIREDLGSVNWAEMNSLNVQERWDLFMEKITNCIEKHVPVIRYTGKRLKPKWMDGNCVRAVRSKFKSWKQYLRTRNRYDYERYCANRNRATKATIKAKKNLKRALRIVSRTILKVSGDM